MSRTVNILTASYTVVSKHSRSCMREKQHFYCFYFSIVALTLLVFVIA